MPLVSVYVPIYNVEQYIEKCCRTLFEQNIDDIEYIFIDDHSPDNSIEIVKKVLNDYPNRIQQVKLLNNTKNIGVSKSIHKAILECTGDYIIRCDPDDYVELDIYKKMLEIAYAESADVVICEFGYETNNGVIPSRQSEFINKEDAFVKLLKQQMHGSLCNKLIKRNLFNSICYWPQKDIWEDWVISIQVLHQCKKAKYLPYLGYYYFQNPKSLLHGDDTKKLIFRWEAVCENTKTVINYLEKYKLETKFKDEIIALKFKAKDHIWPLLKHWGYWWKWYRTYPEINILGIFYSRRLLGIRRAHFLALFGLYPLVTKIINIIKSR